MSKLVRQQGVVRGLCSACELHGRENLFLPEMPKLDEPIWMVREECNEDCSNKQVCVECAEGMAPTAGRRNTRSRSSNCTECKAPGNYLCVPVSKTENQKNVTYDCCSCNRNGKYELIG